MVSNMNLTNTCKDIGVKQNIPLQKKKNDCLLGIKIFT